MPKPKTRIIKAHCGICDHDFDVEIPFGCLIKSHKGDGATNSYVEIIRERHGRADLFLAELNCENCGCCSELTFKNANAKT